MNTLRKLSITTALGIAAFGAQAAKVFVVQIGERQLCEGGAAAQN